MNEIAKFTEMDKKSATGRKVLLWLEERERDLLARNAFSQSPDPIEDYARTNRLRGRLLEIRKMKKEFLTDLHSEESGSVPQEA